MARTSPIIRVRRGFSLVVLCLLAAASTGAVLQPAATWQFCQRVVDGLRGTLPPGILATAGSEDTYAAIGEALRDALAAEGGFPLTLQKTAGSVENLRLLESGETDFALIQSGTAGSAQGDIAALARLHREYVHLLVPTDSAVETIRDLAGKRIGVGPLDRGDDALGAEVFAYFDFFDQPLLVREEGADLDRAFRDGRIDAMFIVAPLFAPAMEELFASGWYRLVPIPEAPAIARYLPGVVAEDLPHSLYGPDRSLPATIAPFPTLAVDTLLVTRRDESPRRVTALLEGLFHGTRLEGASPLARNDVAGLLPVHPAAAAYYARNTTLAPTDTEIAAVFSLGLASLAGVLCLLVAWWRGVRQAHQRSLMTPYFERMLAYGAAMKNTDCPETLMESVHEMLPVIQRAERAWLAGKLDAAQMENLYLAYNLHSRNAFDKILKLQMQRTARGVPVDMPAPVEARGDFAGRRYWEAPEAAPEKEPEQEKEVTAAPPRVAPQVRAPRPEAAPVVEEDEDLSEFIPDTAFEDSMDAEAWFTQDAYDTEAMDELADVPEGIGPVRIRRRRSAEHARLETHVSAEPTDERDGDDDDDGKDQLKLF